MPNRRLSRRAVLGGAVLSLATPALAGCLSDIDEEEPIPTVVNAEATPPVEEVETRQPVDIEALIHNAGAAGSIVLTARTYPEGSQEALDTETATFEMDAETQETLVFSMTVTGAADRLEVSGEPEAEHDNDD